MITGLRRVLENWEAILAGACFVALTLIINVEVVRRYFFHAPGAYSEELARYLFIYCIFLSMAYAVKEHAHIITDIIPTSIPKRLSLAIDIFATLVFFAFSLFMIKTGISYTEKMILFERPTEAMALPLSYFCIAPPIGFAASAFRCLQRLAKLCAAYRNSTRQQ